MDPYLEEPAGWAGVHDRLIGIIRTELNRRLDPEFVADTGTTVSIVAPDERRWVFPDVFVVEAMRRAVTETAGRIIAPLQVVIDAPETVQQPHVIIRDRASRAVVTKIEILSPIYKTPARTRARADCLRERADVMASGTHWVEIGLLRAGERPPAMQGVGDYCALVKRAGDERGGLWPIGVRDRLPVIGIPPRDADDMALDLQAALDLLYAQGRYADLIDYDASPPPPPFRLDDQQWLAARLAHRQDAPA